MITLEYLHRVLDYNPGSGLFTWVSARPKVRVGAVAGTTHRKGHVEIEIDAKCYLAHRLAWFHVYGVWPKDQIDHRDMNKSNNRLDNLREATNSQNGANKKRYKNNKSGYKGVCYNTGKWLAQIKHGGVVRHLGRFDDPQDAHRAYAKAAAELHGEFARKT